MKLPAFFLKFETEECVLRVNKSEITGENTFNVDYFGIKGNRESIKTEQTFLGCFCRFVTSPLILKGEICIFTFLKHCLVFAIFKQF